MIYKTERLVIRELNECDMRFLYDLNNDEEVMRFISTKDFKGTTMEKECLSIQNQMAYYGEHKGFGMWIAEHDSEAIGWVSLKYNPSINGHEIGYRFIKSSWRKGFATEASQGLLDYARDKEVKSVYGIALRKNVGSIKVMKNIGMDFIKEDYLYDEHVDVYGIEVGN